MRKPRNIGAGLRPKPVAPEQPAKPDARSAWLNRTLIIHRHHLGQVLEWVFILTASESRDAWFISRVEDSGVPGQPRLVSNTRCVTEAEAEANWVTLKAAYSKDKYEWSEFGGTSAKPLESYPVTPEAGDDYYPAQLGDL